MGYGPRSIKKNKIILLDEATANIDVETESKIQKAIQNYFADATIIMIAHRLNTIMFCDKILVLEKGKVVEFDYLSKLKNSKKSVFGGMLRNSKNIKNFLK